MLKYASLLLASTLFIGHVHAQSLNSPSNSSLVGGPNVQAGPDGQVPPTKLSNGSVTKAIGLSTWVGFTENNYSTSSVGETTRVLYTAKGPISQLQLFLPTQTALSGAEAPAFNPLLYAAAVEYPLGANSSPPVFTLAGNSPMAVGVAGAGVLSDPLGISIPAGAQFAIRYGTFIATPPASIALAASTTGGALAAATYYYQSTCVLSGIESAPSAEVSVAATGSTSQIKVTATATANPLGCNSIKIYRATSTGAETYLGSIPGPGLTYIDLGATPTVAGATPPAAQKYSFSGLLGPTMYSSSSLCGGAQTNNVSGTGTFGVVGPNSCYVNLPILVGDDVTSHPVIGLGDSIQAGSGITLSQVNEVGVGDLRSQNWFTRSLPQGTWNVLNLSIPSTQAVSFVGTTPFGASLRQRAMAFGSNVVSNLGTNDLAQGVTWQNLALAHIQIAQSLRNRGQNYYIATLLPRGTTTDNMVLASNYTVGSFESTRVAYNTWIRNGMLVSAGQPVLTNGTPTPYIANYFDAAQALGESNASNVPTLNGGYWPFPSTPYATATNASGSSGSQANYANFSGGSSAAYAMAGMVLKVTSGTYAGQTCIVQGNSPLSGTTGIIYCGSGITGSSFAIGDNFAFYLTPGFDGLHPSLYGHTLISAGAGGFAAWATAYLIP